MSDLTDNTNMVVTLEQRWEVSLLSSYRRCQFWQKKNRLSDEAHFDLGGYVNKQICRIWGTEKTGTYTLKSRRTLSESLFGADFGRRGIIKPFFFENEQGEAIAVHGNRYRATLNEFLFTKI